MDLLSAYADDDSDVDEHMSTGAPTAAASSSSSSSAAAPADSAHHTRHWTHTFDDGHTEPRLHSTGDPEHYKKKARHHSSSASPPADASSSSSLYDQDDEEDDDAEALKKKSSAAAAASSSSSAPVAAAAAASSIPRPSYSSSSSMSINTAPDVPLDFDSPTYYVNPQQSVLHYNPRVEELYAPVQGPSLPTSASSRRGGGSTSLVSTTAIAGGLNRNHQLGNVEATHINSYIFESNYNRFLSTGKASDMSVPIGAAAGQSANDRLIFDSNRTTDLVPRINTRVLTAADKQELRAKRKAAFEDAGDIETWKGPWASRETKADEDARKVEGRILTPEQQAEKDRVEKMRAKKKSTADAAAAGRAGGDEAKEQAVDPKALVETTTFHGTEEKDYQGRTYMHPPPGSARAASSDIQCYLPKRLIHTFTGHSKGVNAIKYLPNTGHLLLSASNDATCKIWNVTSSQGNYRLLRTYAGHTEGVRSIDFNHDGTKFTTCSYDKYVKYWDTETGQCISRHTTHKVPLCTRFNPEVSQNHEVYIGQQNKLVVTLDLKSNSIVQTYNEHLGPVNSVTFIDGNRRFVSTSDDKSIFVWESGIPVVLKRIAEPDMHSMPYVAVHPNTKYFVGQSQDNQILCFTALNKYKLKRDKRFLGHLTAGYACEIGFSPDGQYIMSGDAQGRIVFWDWKTSKVYKKLKAHDQVSIGCQWHPLETSKIATCSWDGTIKLWD